MNFSRTSQFRLSRKTEYVSMLHTPSLSHRPLPAAVAEVCIGEKGCIQIGTNNWSQKFILAAIIDTEVRAEFWLEAKALGSIQNFGNKLWLTTAGSGKQTSQDTPLNPACFPRFYPWPTMPVWGNATSASMGNTSTGR
jgi:hypothetical protein